MSLINKRNITISGILTYSILLILSVWFYMERTAMCDAAFQLQNVLFNNQFAIQVNRFGSFFTQSFPLIAARMGASLQTAAVLYSMSFVIMYFIAFLILIYYFKNYWLALALLLCNTLMVRHSFYWIQCEMIQGLVYTFLHIAFVYKHLIDCQTKKRHVIISIILQITALFTYPLLLFLILFAYVILFFQFKNQCQTLLLYIDFYIMILATKSIYFQNYYDTKATEGLENIFIYYPNYYTLVSFKNFYQYVINDYYTIVIVLILMTFFSFLAKRHYLLIFLTWIATLGIVFLININYAQGAKQFYLESQYISIAFIISVTSTYILIVPQYSHVINKIKHYIGIVLISMILLSCIRIYHTAKPYTNKNNYLRTIIKQYKNKTVFKQNKIAHSPYTMPWGFSYEIWLLSTIENKVTSYMICEEQENQFEYLMGDKYKYATSFQVWDTRSIPSRYFIADTNTYYHVSSP